jgi:5,10-methylenetetrahydrofolate reductase
MSAASKEDRPLVSMEIAVELIEGMREFCQGVHIMALGWERYIPDILSDASLI